MLKSRSARVFGFGTNKSHSYDPETCRFVNADGYVSTGSALLGYNMFAYCLNNPISNVDYSGSIPMRSTIVCDGSGTPSTTPKNSATGSNMSKFNFTFNNVIFCSMQSCLFWGGGDSIYDIYVKENEVEREQLIKIQNSNKAYHDFSRFLKEGAFFTVELQINSGDTLTIICEDLDYNILQ